MEGKDMSMAKVPVLTPEGNLNSYLQQIRKFRC